MELKKLLVDLINIKNLNNRIIAIYRYDQEEGHTIVIDNITHFQFVKNHEGYMLVASNTGKGVTTVRDLGNQLLRCEDRPINSVRANGQLIHFKWINVVDYENGTIGLILH